MSQKISDLLLEFTAITEFIASGETPSPQDRQNAIGLWGKMIEKLATGPMPFICEFEKEKRIRFLDSTEKESKMWELEKNIEKSMEKEVPGSVAKYMSAKEIVERINICVRFLEKWLAETEPNRQTIVTMDPLAIKSIFEGMKGTELGPVHLREDTAQDEKPKRTRTPRKPAPIESDEDARKEPDSPGVGFEPKSPETAPAEAPKEPNPEPVTPPKKSAFAMTMEMAGKSAD